MADHGFTINQEFLLVFRGTMVFPTIAALWMEQRKFFADFHKITKEFCENQQKIWNYAKTSYLSKKLLYRSKFFFML
jgi:hypothetical protein